jgi:hypothetical protein
MRKNIVVILVGSSVLALSIVRAQDAKFAADNLKYSRDFYSKVHLVAIAKLDFGEGGTAEFKYDRYPNGGPERIQAGNGEEFARKDGKTWLKSNDWGETGKRVDAQTSKRLNNWVGLIEARLNGKPTSNDPSEGATVMKFIGKEDQGEREEFVFEESKEKPRASSYPRVSFGRFKNDKTDHVLLSEFSGPMGLGERDAQVKISFSHLIAVKVQETRMIWSDKEHRYVEADDSKPPESSPLPAGPAEGNAQKQGTGKTVSLLDGKLKLDIPSDFSRDPDDPKDPKTVAKFSGPDGAWGTVLRGTHGLTPDKLEGYLKMRVSEYNKGFKWLPKDSHLQWLKKDLVIIDGRKWADWSFVPVMKGRKDYSHNPVYTRNLTTSYKGQLLEINFTSNLNTNPKLKQEIDHIMDSVHLEE